ncbi:MAG: helix-turn-helix domain-containing protein [Clostridia bacterium]|nr:helix-turn-helix domain-containing protein [Clostridia bacterium]
MKSVFSERLRALRQEKNIGQIQLAKELDVGKSIISLWELGKCEPTLSKLVAMSQYFGVSIDYLAGIED